MKKINWDYISNTSGVVAIVLILLACVIGTAVSDFKEKERFERCTSFINAALIRENIDTREMAPYHGGPIYDQYLTVGKYSWEVNGVQYSFSVNKIKDKMAAECPAIVLIKYNPDNPDEYYIDATELSGFYYTGLMYNYKDDREYVRFKELDTH